MEEAVLSLALLDRFPLIFFLFLVAINYTYNEASCSFLSIVKVLKMQPWTVMTCSISRNRWKLRRMQNVFCDALKNVHSRHSRYPFVCFLGSHLILLVYRLFIGFIWGWNILSDVKWISFTYITVEKVRIDGLSHGFSFTCTLQGCDFKTTGHWHLW